MHVTHTYTHLAPPTPQSPQILDSEADKLPALLDFLSRQRWGGPDGARVIVFTSTKRTADRLEHELGSAPLPVSADDAAGGAPGRGPRRLRAAAVHGDKNQRAREGALAAFRLGRVPVLVATDVAARGLDIRGVTAVVNYDFPMEIEMWVGGRGRFLEGA
jgi:superfamily II DNA/RNA helicase